MTEGEHMVLPKWEVPQKPNCPKRQLRATLKRGQEILAVGYNTCAPNGHSHLDEHISLQECFRMTRDKTNGKEWRADNGFHAEASVFLIFLISIGVIKGGEYASYASRFARWRFDEEGGEELLEELFALFTPEAKRLLAGAHLELEGIDWVCYVCGRLLVYLGVATGLPVAQTSDREPSTGQ